MNNKLIDYTPGTFNQIAEQMNTLLLIRDERGFTNEDCVVFEHAWMLCRFAEIYATRIDQYINGADDAETFHRRLTEQVNAYIKE